MQGCPKTVKSQAFGPKRRQSMLKKERHKHQKAKERAKKGELKWMEICAHVPYERDHRRHGERRNQQETDASDRIAARLQKGKA